MERNDMTDEKKEKRKKKKEKRKKNPGINMSGNLR